MKNLFRFFAIKEFKPVIEDKQEVDRLYKRGRISVLLSISIGYAMYYVGRLGLSVIREPLISEGVLTVTQTGMIGGVIYITYGIGKVTNGFMADHADVRKLFALGLIGSGVFNIIMGSMSVFTMFLLVWGLNGFFQAFGASASAQSMVNWFSNRERGGYYSIWNGGISLGEGATFAVTAAIAAYFGWRVGFWASGAIAIVTGLVTYTFMKDRPRTLGLPLIQDWKDDHGIKLAEGQEEIPTSELHKQMFRLPRLWVITVAAFFLYFTRYAISGWGVFYLQEARGLSLTVAGAVVGVGFLAGIIGGLVYGFSSDWFFKGRRPPATAIFGGIDVLVLILIFYYPTTNVAFLTFLFMAHGFFFPGAMMGISLFALDIMPKRVVGAANGVFGLSSYIAAASVENVSAYLVDKGSQVVDGVTVYDFSYAITFWVGSLAVSLVLLSCLWKAEFMD